MQSSLSSESLHAHMGDSTVDLPPLPWTPVSESPTSLVFDMQDGTVLKAVRKRGGLSSGEARWRREAAMLRAMEGADTGAIRVPHLISLGEFEQGGFLNMPMVGWLRLEKLEGRAYSFDAFSMLPAEQRERMGERLGAAIAAMQLATQPQLEAVARLGDPVTRQLALVAQSVSSPQDYPKLKRLEALWAKIERPTSVLHGNLTVENIMWGEGDAIALTGWSEAGAGEAVSDLAQFEPLGVLRDSLFRGYTARAGARPDMEIYRLAVAARAFVTLAIEGDQGHPREGMRRRRMLEEYLFQAGIE